MLRSIGFHKDQALASVWADENMVVGGVVVRRRKADWWGIQCPNWIPLIPFRSNQSDDDASPWSVRHSVLFIKVVCAQLCHTFISIVLVIWPSYNPHQTPYSWLCLFMVSFIRLCIPFPMTHMYSFYWFIIAFYSHTPSVIRYFDDSCLVGLLIRMVCAF